MAFPEIVTSYNSDNINDMIDSTVTTGLSYYLNKINDVDSLNQNLHNDKRHIQINEYAILKYQAQTVVLKKIIIICCIALIGSLLFYVNIFPNMVYNVYLGIVFGIGVIIIMFDLYDIFRRSSYDFNEYDYNFFYRPPRLNDQSKNYNTVELSNLPTVCK
jgi:hypothetical protein